MGVEIWVIDFFFLKKIEISEYLERILRGIFYFYVFKSYIYIFNKKYFFLWD